MIPCAIPTHIAAPKRSAAPWSKDFAMSFTFMSFSLNTTPMIPETRPIILGGTSATDGTVLNTILHSISNGMQNFPPVISAWFMYIFQSVFNFFVVSGSGQAALTMPIMAPLADLVGVERQVAVVAYQLGDAFTNFIVPTSGCLLGALAAAKLDWGKWAKFQIKFQAVLFAFGSIAVILAVVIGLS